MTNATDLSNKVVSVEIMTAQTGTGAGTAYHLPRLKTFHIEGITTGTVKLEGSNDGTNFFVLSTDTADNLRELNTPVVWIRGNVTAASDVSVTITAGFEKEL